MIVPDVNLLVYAYNADAPRHAPAREWWEQTVRARLPVGLAWAVNGQRGWVAMKRDAAAWLEQNLKQPAGGTTSGAHPPLLCDDQSLLVASSAGANGRAEFKLTRVDSGLRFVYRTPLLDAAAQLGLGGLGAP